MDCVAKDCNLSLWATLDKIAMYKNMGFTVEGPEVQAYEGFLNKIKCAHLSDGGLMLTEISGDNIGELIEYDAYINGDNRQEFITRQLNLCEKIIVATKGNRMVGYGALENFDGVFSVTPLYANSNDVAWELWHELLKYVPMGSPFTVSVLTSNTAAVNMCNTSGLKEQIKTVAMFSRYSYPFKPDSVYCTYGGTVMTM